MTKNEMLFKDPSASLYSVQTISLLSKQIADGPSYALRQLYDKVVTVKKYAGAEGILSRQDSVVPVIPTKPIGGGGGVILDIGCATGETLRVFDDFKTRIGVDFSERYISEAVSRSRDRGDTIRFVIGDAAALPFNENTVDCAYSFSTLYVIPDLIGVFQNVWRVLKPGGIAVLDCGNIRSLNAVCVRRYVKEDGWASLECPAIGKTLAMLRKCGFEILERRCYQLLPLYARKPRWLWPLLHPVWERVAAKRVKGKMIDEWISSLPVLRSFAFRNVLVCRKSENGNKSFFE